LDDFAVHADSTIKGDRWFQSKHTVDPSKKISDLDVEFWKTISLWIDASPDSTVSMFLVTNGGVSEGSGVEKLTLGSGDPVKASDLLFSAVEKSKSTDIKKYSKSFMEMAPSRRIEFLSQVALIVGAPGADQIDAKIHRGLAIACRPQHHQAVTEWLRGWWHDRVRQHLMDFWRGNYDPIPVREVMDRIFAIQDRLRSDDLPIFDHRESSSTELSLDLEDAVFVQQLRLIAVHSRRIEHCILEHNRAYQQRSYWQRFSLLSVGELERYENILKGEWMRYFLPLSGEDEDQCDESAVCKASRKNFDELDKSSLPAIRTHVSERFIANGSLHIMADRLEIGWHPDYVARLRGVLDAPSVREGGAA
ncbi:ABC-three component system protein, partial [Streptomyces sp. NPDC058171]